MSKRICISDLDGTLLHSDRKISAVNRSTLNELGEAGVTRVLATGRSLWSVRRVIKEDDPFDFVIFATGAGIMDWKKQELIYSCDLNKEQIRQAYDALESYQIDYMLHHAVPDTHFMHYRSCEGSQDFWERIDYYKAFAAELDEGNLDAFEKATQFMAIVAGDRQDVYQGLKQKLYPMNTIRTTSPIDLSSLWIEIFAPEVTKGKTLAYFLASQNCPLESAMVIGNDYNDEDMLQLIPNAYVTANAPTELRALYHEVAHHDQDGFTEAVTHWQNK